ncbi:cation diffusion facilitator family transporter [Methylotuvimicrobium alcaliphilum]|uniref:Cation diffusion facilitator family transporter n=1 Tax=Methylotuvimicrobium alcaliphilum (strain DSM 19304 / NCIMB 14124 / VKM B-2133 / 20Z) TaxID=1091494 RepID=G4SYF8_META2|nr:cation diffusion facilitator family transporter [Methylotuvimicrobium alcaliphilum]CCE22159.1 Cation diffusion facilitator family transporter [Methylotuvimicrobium alcaliphilum 20Z]
MIEARQSVESDRLKAKVSIVAAWTNLALSVLKIGFGILGQSAALIADGVHSLSDLVSDLLVITAIKLGAREADFDHPYGHRRYETIATVALGVGLIIVAGGIAYDAMERVRQPERLLMPEFEAMAIAALSVLTNEWLYQYTKRIAKQTRSKLLLANAWHHRSDAISSIVVIIGVAGVWVGYEYADAVAAGIVALMIAKIGLSLVIQSIKELVDTSLPETLIREIRRVIKTTPGVRGIHLLRTRQMGEDAYIDAHIVVDARISVSEGHMIGDAVRQNLKAEFDDVVDVLVHVDPEDDEFIDEPVDVLRADVQGYLRNYLAELFEDIEDFKIHYLEGTIEIEVILPHLMGSQPERMEKVKQQCALMQGAFPNISKISVLLKI